MNTTTGEAIGKDFHGRPLYLDMDRIKRLVMDLLLEQVKQSNTGQVTNKNTPLTDLHYLRVCEVHIKHSWVEVDGKRVWTIKRKFSSRKVNGNYKELRPSLVPYKHNPDWDIIEKILNS